MANLRAQKSTLADNDREKYAAFIDVLGGSNIVRASVDDADKQATIVEEIERLRF